MFTNVGHMFCLIFPTAAVYCCLKLSCQDAGLSLGGRQIVVTMAVSRQQAGDLIQNKEKEKEKKDTRNLYLAREGSKLVFS